MVEDGLSIGAPDPNIIQYEAVDKTLTTFSDDITKLGTHELRIRVYSVDFWNVEAFLDFTIIIDDPCQFAVLSISSTMFIPS